MSTSTTDPCPARGGLQAPRLHAGLAIAVALLLAPDSTFADGAADGAGSPPAAAAAAAPRACRADDAAGFPVRVRRVRGVSFDWITADLELAITERNFRITGRNSIGKGLRERGHEGYPDYEIIHFCNLENARAVLDLDPGFVAQMPCRVTVHVEGEEVVVSMLLLPETHRDARIVAFSHQLNAELCAIQDYAVERE